LIRRNAFDLDEETVNYNSLLKRLISELIIDEGAVDSKRMTTCTDGAHVAREEAKQAREVKKKEAIERSRLRQANPQYFEEMVAQNIKNVDSANDINEVVDPDEDETKSNIDEITDEHDVNPFRPSYAKDGKRNKIFVR
jgi:hypothetical protein